MRDLTVRNIPDAPARALRAEKRRRGSSLDETVTQLLAEVLGVKALEERSNGLRQFAGTWSEAEHERFEAAVAATEQIDEDVWR